MFNIQPAFLAQVSQGSSGGDSLWDQTALLLRGEAVADSSKNPKEVSLVGAGTNTPSLSIEKFKFGSALRTTGAGASSFLIPYHEDLAFPAGQDFTLETWVNFNSSTTPYCHILGLGNGNQPNNPGSYALAVYNGKLWFNALIGTATLVANQWYHIAVVRSGTTVRMFVDGVLDATGTNNTAFIAGSPFTIGDRTAGNPLLNYPANAFYDELRVTRAARYTAAGFTPPTAPFLSGSTPKIYGRWDALRKYPTITFVAGTDGRGLTKTSGSAWISALGDSRTIVRSGKWYFEVTIVSGDPTFVVGFGNTTMATGSYIGVNTDSTGYYSNGTLSNPPPGGNSLPTYVVGDTIGMALDIDGKNVSYYKKSGATMTLIATRNWSTVVTGTNFQPAVSFFSNTTILANFGNAPFTAVPDGYNAGFYAS